MNSWDQERSENKTQTDIFEARNKLLVHNYNWPDHEQHGTTISGFYSIVLLMVVARSNRHEQYT